LCHLTIETPKKTKDDTMDPTYRLRIATRLHFLLLRRYGQDIEVSHLLKSRARNHDGLWLCKATGDAELIALARLLAHANHLHAKEEARLREEALMSAAFAAGNAAPNDMPWSFDTSGFGLTHPQHLVDEGQLEAAGARHRFSPLRWLKRGAQHKQA
jgi:hypothetical protein